MSLKTSVNEHNVTQIAGGALSLIEGRDGLTKDANVNLMFVDPSVENIDQLKQELADNTIAYKLDATADGISQVTEALADLKSKFNISFSSLHFVSHGAEGEIQLGSTTLNSTAISNYQDQLESWKGLLTDDADLLFYGCNLAKSEAGESLLKTISNYTDADIAASNDLTGHSKLQGDWDLEYTIGDIDSGIGFKDSVKQSYKAILPQKNLLKDDFETALSKTRYQLQSNTSYGLDITKNPKGSGNVFRAELRKGDNWKGRARAELRIKDKVKKFDVVHTYKFSTLSTSDKTSGETIAQWHEPKSTGLGPPLALAHDKGQFLIKYNQNGTNRLKHKTGISIKPGEWSDWTFQIKWSRSGQGFMKAFHNGEKVFEYNGKNSLQSSPSYMKMGIYKPNWKSFAGKIPVSNNEKVVVYFDNLSVVEGAESPSQPSSTKPASTQEITPLPSNTKPVSIQEIPVISKPSNPPSNSSAKSGLTIQAEDLQRGGFRVENNSLASGGKLLSLVGNGKNEEARAVYVHKGDGGTYDMDLHYFDENDGTGQIRVLVNNKEVDSWSMDRNSGSNRISADSRQARNITGLDLKAGDRVTIEGKENGGEHVRLDYFNLKPINESTKPVSQPAPVLKTPEPPVKSQSLAPSGTGKIRIQAEDLQRGGFRVENNSLASGGKVLSLAGKGGREEARAVYVHKGDAGTYNMNLSYFDESDGTGQIRVLVNNKEVDSWSMNQNSGSDRISADSRQTRNITGLKLKAGDLVTLVGKENDKEHVRLDYFDLEPSNGQPSARPVTVPATPAPSTPPTPPAPTAPSSSSGRMYQGQNGQIVIEAESAKLKGDWERTTIQGREAILYDGKNSFRKPSVEQTLEYDFRTDEAGNYNITLYSGRDKKAMERFAKDLGNDAFIGLENLKTGKVVLAPTKVYTNLGESNSELRWGKTFDLSGSKTPAKVQLEANTDYRLFVAGRSDGYVLERIHLNKDRALTNANAPVSKIG